MLIDLHLKDVGPAAEMSIAFRERMNFITGDNGLGKSFLLDVAWWALTRTWPLRRDVRPPERPDIPDKFGVAVPRREAARPRIDFSYSKATGSDPFTYKSTFNREREEWSVKAGRPPIPGLVIYAQVDGGFSVWDPARNYWKGKDPGRPPAYHFRPYEVWSGHDLSEGLVRDWASWQREDGEAYRQLCGVLAALSPPKTMLEPGRLKRLFITDPKDYPTIRMPYGEEVAVIHASAGIRRVLALAYLLVWTWREHATASELLRKPPAREIIFLVDEVEAHLHPQYQRHIIPALIDVMEALTGQQTAPVQIVAVTHSPLVLASIEPHFESDKDAIWTLDLDADRRVTLDEFPFSRQGGADEWLTSEVFDLEETGSIPAEEALARADRLLQTSKPDPAEIAAVEDELRRTLSDIDPFWVDWTAWRKAH